MLRQAQLIRLAVLYQQVRLGDRDVEDIRPYIKSALRTLESDSTAWAEFGQGLNTDEGIVHAAEAVIEDLCWRDLSMGGLQLVPLRIQDPEGRSSWAFTLHFQHLLNVIWYQAYRTLVQQSPIRTCGNERCKEPLGLFEADRPNRIYCSSRCRNAHNIRKFRRVDRQKNLMGGILP